MVLSPQQGLYELAPKQCMWPSGASALARQSDSSSLHGSHSSGAVANALANAVSPHQLETRVHVPVVQLSIRCFIEDTRDPTRRSAVQQFMACLGLQIISTEFGCCAAADERLLMSAFASRLQYCEMYYMFWTGAATIRGHVAFMHVPPATAWAVCAHNSRSSPRPPLQGI